MALDLQNTTIGSCPEHPRRRCGRVKQRSFKCNLGEIIDISAAGMRVRCRIKPSASSILPINLKGFDLPGPLFGKRVWSKRLGLFLHEVGIEFAPCTSAEVLQRLTTVAGCGGIPRLQRAPIAHAA